MTTITKHVGWTNNANTDTYESIKIERFTVTELDSCAGVTNMNKIERFTVTVLDSCADVTITNRRYSTAAVV